MPLHFRNRKGAIVQKTDTRQAPYCNMPHEHCEEHAAKVEALEKNSQAIATAKGILITLSALMAVGIFVLGIGANALNSTLKNIQTTVEAIRGSLYQNGVDIGKLQSEIVGLEKRVDTMESRKH